MKPLFAFTCLLSLASASDWENFKALHAKSHAPHEEPLRMANFMRKDAALKAHNERFAQGLESYEVKHNQYSDLSPEEVSRVAFGFVPAVHPSEIPRAQPMPAGDVPASYDWRDRGVMSPVKNQLYCGSCYAFAVTGAMEAWLAWKQSRNFSISEQEIVDCSFRKYLGFSHNNGCQGGWPTAVYMHLNARDVFADSSYGYTSGNTGIQGLCRAFISQNNFVKGKLSIQNVMPQTEDDIRSILVQKGPLVIAMAADNQYKDMFNNLGDGVFDDPRGMNATPNHAVVLVGYGTDAKTGKDYWLIRNSWGTQWGVGGYGKIVRGKNMCNLMQFGVWYVDAV